MSEFSLALSVARAEARLRGSGGPHARRSDAGKSRLDPAVEAELVRELARGDRPDPAAALAAIQTFCAKRGLRAPSRATVYAAIDRVEAPAYAAAELPEAVQRCLHNVDGARVPGDQIVFACFNYGDTRALSFASAMPWPCLRRAAQKPGFRPKSLGLLRAVLAARGL